MTTSVPPSQTSVLAACLVVMQCNMIPRGAQDVRSQPLPKTVNSARLKETCIVFRLNFSD